MLEYMGSKYNSTYDYNKMKVSLVKFMQCTINKEDSSRAQE